MSDTPQGDEPLGPDELTAEQMAHKKLAEVNLVPIRCVHCAVDFEFDLAGGFDPNDPSDMQDLSTLLAETLCPLCNGEDCLIFELQF